MKSTLRGQKLTKMIIAS